MTSPNYVCYGNPYSYFTRKLELALRWYGADFEARPKSPDVSGHVEQRAGTHQIPVLRTPENWMLADTTPILDALDGRFPARRMFPGGPLGVLVHVVEDWFDEWIARTAVHYRWNYPECADFAAPAMARAVVGDHADHVAAVEGVLRGWGPRSVRATGVSGPGQQRAAEAEYERMLAALNEQLAHTRYALGDRPCAVDAVVMGGLVAHFAADPVPRRVVAKFERVQRWLEQGRDWDGTGDLVAFPGSTPFAAHVLLEARGAYRAFISGNSSALRAEQKAFVAPSHGEDVSYKTREYPEAARRMVKARISRLAPAEQAAVAEWLAEVELDDLFGVAAADR